MKVRVLVQMLFLILFATALVGCGGDTPRSSAAASSGGVAWERELGAALGRAHKEKKIVMVDFYADWCGWCKRLDKNTFSDARVQQALNRLVPLKLNAEKEGRSEAQRYRVEGFPTIVFVDAKGNEVGRIGGYMDAGPFLAELEDILRKS